MVLLKLVQIRPGIEIDLMIKRLDDLARRFDNPDFQALPQQERPGGSVPTPGEAPASMEPRRISDGKGEPVPTPQPQQTMPSYKPTDRIDDNSPPPPEPRPIDPPEDPAGRWNLFLNALAGSLPFASAILSKGRLQKISNTDIVVELNGTAFDRGRIESKQGEIESVCHDFFGKPLHLALIGDCAPKEYGNDEKSPAKLRQEILNHPLVADAIKRFNGTVVDVKLNERSNP
jgi:DNA polymerase-3 subunit gamma/tau